MKTFCILVLLSLSISLSVFAQDTFSIVVADTATGEIGSAGASCISNSRRISDIVDGFGAIHTQAYYLNTNQNNAHYLMEDSLSPDSIIKSMIEGDAQGTPQYRQYGVVDLKGRSAAYTGDSCMKYRGHVTGLDGSIAYSIQGNILLGKHVIDSIQSRFLHTTGTLQNRLMAALQGANFPGADSRCLDSVQHYKKPAISSFIRLAKPGDMDKYGSYYMDLYVNNTKAEENPIDSLQKLFDAFKEPIHEYVSMQKNELYAYVIPNPVSGVARIKIYPTPLQGFQWTLSDLLGKTLQVAYFANADETVFLKGDIKPGLYFYTVKTNNGTTSGKVMLSN